MPFDLPPPPPPAYVVQADVPYLAADRAERLDVYQPAATAFPGPRPAILLIHGGGWRIGDKADARERSIGATLATHGYVVFSINYLLNTSARAPDGGVRHTRVVWPRNFEDCEAALAWIAGPGRHEFSADPARVATLGGSAGGHLALLLAARHPEKIRASVSLYGIGDLQDPALAGLARAFAAATPEQTAAHLAGASPLPHLTPASPPLLLVHGTADTTVPVAHARRFTGQLSARGVRYLYLELAGAPHSFDLQPAQADLRPTVLAFLAEHLAPPAPASP